MLRMHEVGLRRLGIQGMEIKAPSPFRTRDVDAGGSEIALSISTARTALHRRMLRELEFVVTGASCTASFPQHTKNCRNNCTKSAYADWGRRRGLQQRRSFDELRMLGVSPVRNDCTPRVGPESSSG